MHPLLRDTFVTQEVYSQSTAPGIVIGTGNVGSKLLYTADDINTYLSRNGGVDWIEALVDICSTNGDSYGIF